MADGARIYGDDEVEARLTGNLAHWSLEGGTIRRRYAVQGWKSALMLTTTIGHLAEAAWHHPEITLGYGSVEVRLMSHDVQGITDRDLALAAKIEGVVCWRPGSDAGPFTGTPDDPRFAYLKDDD